MLNDPAIQDWIETAKAVLRWFLDRLSEHGKILKKSIVTDPSYLFLPEEFPEAGVPPSAMAIYLNEFAARGLLSKHGRPRTGVRPRARP